MKDTYASRHLYYAFTAVSLLMGCIFFFTNHLDFIIAIIDTHKFNIPNIAYTLIKIVGAMIIPAFFLVPSMFEFGRIKSIKISFITLGVLYALTAVWIFYFLAANPAGELFSKESITAFQGNKSNPFVSSFAIWDTYSIAGTIFSLIYAAMLIYTGINFDDNRVIVRNCMFILFALKILLPVLYNIIFQNRILSVFWLTNNYADFVSFTLLTASVFIASLSDQSWIELIWDEHSIDDITDEDF